MAIKTKLMLSNRYIPIGGHRPRSPFSALGLGVGDGIYRFPSLSCVIPVVVLIANAFCYKALYLIFNVAIFWLATIGVVLIYRKAIVGCQEYYKVYVARY